MKKGSRILNVSILTTAITALVAPVQAALHDINPQPVTDINPAGDSNPTHITYADDHLYFVATDSHGRSGLYVKTLVKGPNKVADPALSKPPLKIKNFTNGQNVTQDTDNFVVAPNVYPPKNNVLYFHVIGDGLYTTRGTALSTIRLLKWKDTDNNLYVDPQVTPFQGSGNTKKAGVVFTAYKAANGFEPFFTTGTPPSTKILKDVVPGAGSSFPYDYCARPSGIFQDQIIFGAYDSADQYQLHRFREKSNHQGFTLEHFNVSRIDPDSNTSNNLATYPRYMTLAGNDVVFSSGNHAADNGLDLWILDTVNTPNTVSIISGTTNIDPINLETGSSGSTAYFSAFDNGTRVFWQCAGGGSPFAQIYDTTIVGTNPRKIKTFPKYNTPNPSQAKFQTYLIADEGGSPHLYRRFSKDDSIKIKTDTNGDLIVDDYEAVIDNGGNGHIFIVGRTSGTDNSLWVLDNSNSGTIDETATQVLTKEGHPVLNPSNLANATHLAGATSFSRLYFSCSGVGSEFEFKKNAQGQPTNVPRGNEVWVFQVGE